MKHTIDSHYSPEDKQKYLKPETREAVLQRIAELEKELKKAQEFIEELKSLL